MPFYNVLFALGALCLMLFLGNLTYWGLVRYPDNATIYEPNGDPHQGRRALISYGCVGCHVIPGIGVATGRVGPKLEDIGNQVYIAGVLVNNQDNMVRWIRHPKQISPDTAMPDLGVTEGDARDMAAYLYSQGRRQSWGKNFLALFGGEQL